MKTPLLLVAILCSVTMFLHIPPVSADDSDYLNVHPTVINEGQSIMIEFSVPSNTTLPAFVEFSVTYGGVELDRWNLTLNGSYSTSYTIPSQWYYGGYSVRVDLPPATYFADFQYKMSDQRMLLMMNDIENRILGGLFGVIATFGSIVIGIVVFIIVWTVSLVLFFQHVLAHNIIFIDEKGKLKKFHSDSWFERVVNMFRYVTTGHPDNTKVGRQELWHGSALRDKLNHIMSQNPRTRDIPALIGVCEAIVADAVAKQERDQRSIRFVGPETPEEGIDLNEVMGTRQNPSIEESPPKEEKRSKPPERQARKPVPGGAYRMVKDIPEDERVGN